MNWAQRKGLRVFPHASLWEAECCLKLWTAACLASLFCYRLFSEKYALAFTLRQKQAGSFGKFLFLVC